LDKASDTLNTEVLIIGGGAGGLKAAIETSKRGVSNVVLSKGPLGKSGITPLGFTGMTACIGQEPGDTKDVHFRDHITGGHFISEQNLVEALVEDAPRAVKELEEYGVRFLNEKGGYKLTKPPGNTFPRMLRLSGGGYALIGALRKEVLKHRDTKIFEDFVATALLIRDAAVCGALGLDLRTGEFRTFAAKSVILATGGFGGIWTLTDCPPDSTGDGYALASRVGAHLIDMEQQLFYPTVALSPEPIRGLEISYESALELGAIKLRNVLGEHFLAEGSYPTRDELSRLVFKEIIEGRGTKHGGIFYDATGCTKEAKVQLKKTFTPLSRLREFGIDIFDRPVEVAPGAHTSLGGILINEAGETNIQGLFACGEVSGNVHGANRLAGTAYTETQVFGARSGRAAAELAKGIDQKRLDRDQVRAEVARVKRFLETKPWPLRPSAIKEKIKKAVFHSLGVRRERSSLREGLRTLAEIRQEDLPRMCVNDSKVFNLDWLQAIEVENMLDVAEVATASALYREESRGTHYRDDFPYTDNKKWLTHTLVILGGTRLEVKSYPVTITRLLPEDVK
jgi:succinate dehydrogenase/fumarate reductase flavoprotein subunit